MTARWMEYSNKTCLIVYNDTHDMFDTPVILQSNIVHSATEIIQELGKYGVGGFLHK